MNTSKDSTPHFEKTYLQLRGKENRLMEDVQVKQLPFITVGPHANEWKLRARSAKRFIQYIKSQAHLQTILEIGCGNGWFTNMISLHTNANVFGTDINRTELDQAKHLFGNKKTLFIEFDLAHAHWDHPSLDLIVFNASIQYFSPFNQLLLKALDLLNKNGHIHILDSPFYKNSQIEEARKRSATYFKKMGVVEMENFYFHHSMEDLLKLNPVFLYTPPKFPFNKLIKDSPFPWVSISKPNE